MRLPRLDLHKSKRCAADSSGEWGRDEGKGNAKRKKGEIPALEGYIREQQICLVPWLFRSGIDAGVAKARVERERRG